MAKSSMIERDKKRLKVVRRCAQKRIRLKAIIKSPNSSYEEKQEAAVKLQKLPKFCKTLPKFCPKCTKNCQNFAKIVKNFTKNSQKMQLSTNMCLDFWANYFGTSKHGD